MKKSNCFIFIFCWLCLISCDKEIYHPEFVKGDSVDKFEYRNPSQFFQDTSGWELNYLFNLMKDMPKDDLFLFLNSYGIPIWDKGFQKNSSEIRITTVPFVRCDSISGVARIYVTNEDSVKIYFFSKRDIDLSLNSDLTTSEYHAFRGAVQSYILCSIRMGLNADSKYFDWLLSNQYRVVERLKYYCLESWECGGYISSTTGWRYLDKNNFIPEWSGNENQNGCELLFRECWVDWTPRNFPNSWIINGNNGQGTGFSNGNTTSENQTIKNAKLLFLNNWLLENGLNSGKFDFLIDCVGYLPSPFGGSADEFIVMDCMKESIYDHLNLPNNVIDELNLYPIGSENWINILSIEYSGDSWKKAWKRLTKKEKELAKSWPLAALVMFSNKSIAEESTDLLFPMEVQHNDKADAFRHAFFNALNVRYINPELVKDFGDAHESETHSDFIREVEMDIFNNAIGRIKGEQNKNKSNTELSTIIYNDMVNGNLKYLKPINYAPPFGTNSCFWGCISDPNGNHGISSATQLVKTNM